MKVQKQHREFIKREIDKFILSTGKTSGELWEVYKNQGLTRERFLWDLYHASGLTAFSCRTLYDYCNDSHILTALKNWE